jgi:hypothetical protein
MKIDWSRLSEYELEDNTDASQTLACSADGCEDSGHICCIIAHKCELKQLKVKH